jgi:hypothetical protein
MADDTVASRALRRELTGRAFADDPEPVTVVDVEESAVTAADLGECTQVGRCRS